MSSKKNRSALDLLQARGLRAECTPFASQHLESEPRSIYCGFDPTAPSLQLGNLIPITALSHLQARGHRPIILIGGATAMIGDPSGKSKERPTLDPEVVAHNASLIRCQLERFLDFDCGAASALMVNNVDWLASLDIIDFLRGPAKKLSAKRIASLSSVKERMDRENSISVAEFIYATLQAVDFSFLYKRHGCTIQAGGQDQWGNITTGIDLVRREYSAEAHGITFPIITDSHGRKMGKTETGTIWLDKEMCTPFQMHQYFLQLADAEATNWVRQLTFREEDDLADLENRHSVAPELRQAQRELADAVVQRVHGIESLSEVQRQARLAFGTPAESLTDSDLEWLAHAPDFARKVTSSDMPSLLLELGLAESKSVARRLLDQHAITFAGKLVNADTDVSDAFREKSIAIVKKGRRDVRVAVRK